MKEIRLTRTFLKKPFNGVFILLSVYSILEAVAWSIGSKVKLRMVQEAGGLLKYIARVIQTMLLPEVCTLLIVTFLISQTHKWLKLTSIKNNWRNIGQYELRFLPTLTGSFLLFNPITQTVRYLLECFPTYSFTIYWESYILKTFSWNIYFMYLFPVILIGYISLNISLLKDYLKQRREAQEAAEAKVDEVLKKSLTPEATVKSKPLSPYITSLKGRNTTGELDFPINDAYYFTIEDRLYYAELAKGRYSISKTLNELEAELNPAHFLRIKRDYIVNRQAIESYTHWENGKYSIRLNTPKPHTIVIPRTRMQELREWLQQEDLQPFETVS